MSKQRKEKAMAKYDPAKETIEIGSRTYRKFIPHPQEVRDGSLRCISCGQIDEPEWHDDKLCPGTGGALPLSDRAKAFQTENAVSPVVSGSAQRGGGAHYRLRNGKTFRLSLYDCRSTPMPWWMDQERPGEEAEAA